jgi:hypothetical protein
MKISVLKSLLLPWVGLFSLAGLLHVMADDLLTSTGRVELGRTIQSLQPRPSLDTTPVEFSVGGIHYRIPRNYLTTMNDWNGGPQRLVTVTVSIPDLKPLSQETLACFTEKPIGGPRGCAPLSFTINAPGGVSADEAFANSKALYRNQTPINGPFGYELYKIGPRNARVERFRRVEGNRTLIYTCQMFNDHGSPHGICDPVGDRVPSGAVIHFFFGLRYLNDIDRIDSGLRKVVEHFTLQPGDQK